jgi:hypothetical protein
LLADEGVKKILTEKLYDGATMVIIKENITTKEVYDYFSLNNPAGNSTGVGSSSVLPAMGIAIYKNNDILRAEELNDDTILRVLSDFVVTPKESGIKTASTT